MATTIICPNPSLATAYMQSQYLLPEWYPQEAVLLAWPDAKTDWAPFLNEVQQTYLAIIATLNENNTPVILLCRSEQLAPVTNRLPQNAQVLLISADYDDTWLRDYGFLTCETAQGMQPLEFVFNGWGNKFNASKDNQINQSLLASLCQLPLESVDLVVEGGALEIDEQQQLLSTALCLQNPERNGTFSLQEYTQAFKQHLGASQVSIFEHGHLEGDDTDGHIDTLVRFTPSKGLVIQSCYNRPSDSHYSGLKNLVNECQAAFPKHQIFELPLPCLYSQDGDRLPASYANFLISNGQILMPMYQAPEDQIALEIMAEAYPEFIIRPINAAPLVQQFGSIHCISMQVPKGTLRQKVVMQFNLGVSIWNGENNES